MNKLQVLNTMKMISAIAENESSSLEDFLPLKDYAQLGDPNKFLVLGGRGAGKTRIFRTLLEQDGFRHMIGGRLTLFGPTSENAFFVTGYNQESGDFPPQTIMEPLADDKKAAAFWAGSVVILLLHYFEQDERVQRIAEEYLARTFLDFAKKRTALKSPSRWIDYIQESPEDWENFLDEVDEYLSQEDKWIFLAYDYLDKICPRYFDLFPFIRRLLSFWFSHLRRWRRLKCKIFLRNDLYESQMLNFPDSSKITSNCLKLEWTVPSLYRLFVKRLANMRDEETVAYLNLVDGLISEQPDEKLGYIPTESELTLERFINMMIGQYMGNDVKKGRSYTWAPNHLQDTHGILSPRSFLKCFSAAAEAMAEKQEEVKKLPENRILSPSMLQGAVQKVSDERVDELEEEYPWLSRLKKAFYGLTMLMPKSEFISKIEMNLWTEEEQGQLPATTPEGIFEILMKLGIVFVARDGRVNVPEIYLHGFGMKRKGGIRRPTR